ncbi:MAG: L,D-transpeptidase family protein [Sediminibacterium sp.]|nr:L,D-transpeptidase family protein [Sediminibacterium sp.]
MIKKEWFLFFSAVLMLSACNWFKGKEKVQRDLTINQQTSFNTLFLDSVAVDRFLSSNSEFLPFAEQYNDFYTHRNFEFAWFDSTGLSEQAHNFFNLQNNYISKIGDSSIQNNALNKLYESFNDKKFTPTSSNADVLKTELLFTGQFFKYAAKVYKGADLDMAELGWFIPRKKINLTALLDSVIEKKADSPDRYAVLNSQYKLLENNVAHYIALEKKETTDTIPYVPKPLKMGDSSAIIALVKSRLGLLQDDIQLDATLLYDSLMQRSVKKFQKRYGLLVDGAIGNRMIAELNIPIKKRVQQLLVNMERARWMPQENDSNYIVVNIPEFKMHIYDSGRQAFEMNVIVGSAANNTVIFNGNLRYIVFSPYWNVPESIVKKEIMPAMRRNGNYITNHNMEITGYSGKVPIVRQKPGANNSLGLVKFLFPNSYSIYLHDTPNRNLFIQTGRGLSHGCIRIADPKKFAQYLLRSDTTLWNSTTIDSAMHLNKEKWVTLKKTVPVFLVYFTAWVDKNGILNFRKDIYGHDSKMASKLFNE